MQNLLNEARFDFIKAQDKAFIADFTQAMKQRGHDFGNSIGSGYCWGKYMILYTKAKRCLARIYLREDGIVLRLYLNQIDDHRSYLENSPDSIKSVFTGPHATCAHCHNEKDGQCRFRKTYTLDGINYEKCNGLTFEFPNPDSIKLPDDLALIDEFILPKRKKEAV